MLMDVPPVSEMISEFSQEIYNAIGESVISLFFCPKIAQIQGIQLADFGLSKKIGEFTPKCPFQFYLRCYHEPATMFEQVPDMFNVSAWKPYGGRQKWHFQAEPRLDECSFALLMYNLFGERVPEIQEELGGRGACGPMGPKRLLEMP